MPDAHRQSSRRSSFSVAGDSMISSELSIERVNELKKDYITRHKEVSSMLFNTDANFSKKASPIPSVQQPLHTTRGRQQSQPAQCLPPLTPPPKRTAFSEKNSVVGIPSFQGQEDREDGTPASGSMSNFWESILNSPRVISSSIVTTMDLSSLWGGESESRDLQEKKTSSDKLDDDLIGYKDDDDDISTIATDDVFHYNSAAALDDGIGFNDYNNSISTIKSADIYDHSHNANATSTYLTRDHIKNLRHFNNDLVIRNNSSSGCIGSSSGQVTTTEVSSSGASPIGGRNPIIHEFQSQDNLLQKFNSVNKSHDKTSSSNRFNKNGNKRTDLQEIFNDNNNNNDNKISGNNNNDNYNGTNKKNQHDYPNNYEDNFDRSHSNGIERKLHEKDILDFEELRKWRELEREADESFIKSLTQTKLDLIEKLQLLGDLES